MIFPQNRPRPDRTDREVADYFRQKMAQLYINDGNEEMAIAVAPKADREKIRQTATHHRLLPDEEEEIKAAAQKPKPRTH